MKRKYITAVGYAVATFFLFPKLCSGQTVEQKKINELIKRTSQPGTDNKDKIYALDSLSFEYRVINPDEGLIYARKELALAVKMNWNKGIAIANAAIGINYQYKSQYPEALEYFYTALSTFEKINDSSNIAVTLNSIGNIYDAGQNYAKALESYIKAMQIDSFMHIMENYAGDMGNIGNEYMSLGNLNYALQYDLRSLAMFRKIGDSGGVAQNMGNIGNIYKTEYNYALALDYDKQALKLFEEEGDKSSIALNLGNIGIIYLAAADTAKKIKAGALSMPDMHICLTSAIAYIDKGITLSKEIGQIQNIMDFNKALSHAYELQGNYKAALTTYKQYTVAKDSVFSNDSKEKIATLNVQRALEVRNKQMKIDELQISHRHYHDELYLLIIAVSLLIFGVLLKKIFPRLF